MVGVNQRTEKVTDEGIAQDVESEMQLKATKWIAR